MAARSTSIYLSESASIAADQLVIADRRNGKDANRSSVVNRVLTEAAADLKRVEPRRDGEKTIGWDMFYGDFHVGYVDGVASKPQAERQLNSWVHEELSK